MDIQKLIQTIEEFKKIYQKHYVETMQRSIPQFCLNQDLFEGKNQAEDRDIARLEAEMNQVIPSDLKDFYTEIGQLIDENQPEGLTLYIPCITELLAKKGTSRWTQTPTFGLVDMMKLHWSNDRPELNAGSFLTAEQIEIINENYTCIGYWCHEPFYEEVYFIIFDKAHQFSEVKYHQDRFGLLEIQLLDMLKHGIPKKSFEELLHSIFKRLEAYTIEFGENW